MSERTDTERLDWLERQATVIVRLASNKLLVSDVEAEPGYTKVALHLDEVSAYGANVRAAIDAAISRGESEGAA